MQRIAVPMIGGMISSTLLIPAVFGLLKGFGLPGDPEQGQRAAAIVKQSEEALRVAEPAG